MGAEVEGDRYKAENAHLNLTSHINLHLHKLNYLHTCIISSLKFPIHNIVASLKLFKIIITESCDLYS